MSLTSIRGGALSMDDTAERREVPFRKKEELLRLFQSGKRESVSA